MDYDYEYLILEMQESEDDECMTCPYKGDKYKNQCMEIETVNVHPIA